MQCEVCGRHISGKQFKAIIEGARLVVCSDCATLGSLSWEIKPPKWTKPVAKPRKPQMQKLKIPVKKQSQLEPVLELAEDFGALIRKARETQGLSHEELGRKINEKVSLLKKLESHKMRPDQKLAEKLQRTLKIKLLIPPKQEKIPKSFLTTTPQSKSITLGDLIKNREKSEEKK